MTTFFLKCFNHTIVAIPLDYPTIKNEANVPGITESYTGISENYGFFL